MQSAPVPSTVDLKNLSELRQRAAREDPKALAEAAVQFEALFIGLMLKSARDASLGEGILDGADTQQYLELMDHQVALELARSGGFGFGKLIVEQLGGDEAAEPQPSRPSRFTLPPRAVRGLGAGDGPSYATPGAFPQGLPATLESLAPQAAERPANGAETFVARFIDDATAAATKLGIEPKLLLAQAALETGWGAAAPLHGDGRPANNLFGIKATPEWRGGRVAQWTIEHRAGVAERKREEFRAYPSTADSFADYVNLIANTPRYAAALEQAHDAEGFARAVTAAGYATDPGYAEKWLSIYRGERLGGALHGLKPTADEPIQ
jgi:peptidoglycan hydrolase FlgJ